MQFPHSHIRFHSLFLGWALVVWATNCQSLPQGGTWNTDSIESALSAESQRGGSAVYSNAVDNPNLGIAGSSLEDDGGSFSGNYKLAIPLISLPGRGQPLSVNMYYSSQLWSRYYKSGAEPSIEFNVDNDWPSPGWSIGFGKLVFPGILINPDHSRQRLIYGSTPSGSTSKVIDVAGSPFTSIELCCSTVNRYARAILRRGDGGFTQYETSLPVTTPATYYPVTISDANGNVITISYLRDAAGKSKAPAIDEIVDTVGRRIKFHYDLQGRLVALTGPGQGNSERTYTRFLYSRILTNINAGPNCAAYNIPSPIDGITGVVFPATRSAYFLEGRTYYGMATQVWERRGVTLDAPSLVDQGNLLDQGLLTRTTVFDYPAVLQNDCVKDPPTYSTKTIQWADPISGKNATSATTFSSEILNDDRITSVNQQDGSKIRQITKISSSIPKDASVGLVRRIEYVDKDNKVLRSKEFEWEPGFGAAKQRAVRDRVDPLGRWRRTVFTYGGVHSSALVKEEHFGYEDASHSATLEWSQETEYLQDPRYERAHIFNLPLSLKKFGPTGSLHSQTNFAYDEVSPIAIGPTAQHLPAYEPQFVRRCADYERNAAGKPVCVRFKTTERFSPRGNVTTISRYVNATNKLFSYYRYDTAGNILKVFDRDNIGSTAQYDDTTGFSLPVSVTVGSTETNAVSALKTSFSYDMSTGLINKTKDTDGRTTTYSFIESANGWRPKTIGRPDNTTLNFDYDEQALRVHMDMAGPSAAKYEATDRYFDGRGKLRRTSALRGVATNQDIECDSFGRAVRVSLPFIGNAPTADAWNNYSYDSIGRLIGVNLNDERAYSWFYDENGPAPQMVPNILFGSTKRFVDSWGRERWEQMDSSGRARFVVEPAPGANKGVFDPGAVLSEYVHDPAGRLIYVYSGLQPRVFEYDGIGRLVRQSLPERTATLDADGKYLGRTAAARYSDVYSYDSRSNLARRVDARGVRTIYKYDGDPLNRLQSISFDLSGPLDPASAITPTEASTFNYVKSGNIGRISGVDTTATATETYSYDVNFRPSTKDTTFHGIRDFSVQVGMNFDEVGRFAGVLYPKRLLTAGAAGRTTSVEYEANAPRSLKLDGSNLVTNIELFPGSQTKSFGVEIAGGPILESFELDSSSGLPIEHATKRGLNTIASVGYRYRRQSVDLATGQRIEIPGLTSNITAIRDHLDDNHSQDFLYDNLGRLTYASLGNAFTDQIDIDNFSWQEYGYDRFGNKISSVGYRFERDPSCPQCRPEAVPLPSDAIDGQSLSIDLTSNRVTSPGYSYDAAGNLVKGFARIDNQWKAVKYSYDAAGRLAKINLEVNGALIEAYKYGAGPQRLAASSDGVHWIYTAWLEDKPISRFSQSGTDDPVWIEDLFYLGEAPIIAERKVGADIRQVYFVANQRGIAHSIVGSVDSTAQRNETLAFGGASQDGEDDLGGRKFTTYERSPIKLDYALNRYYDSRLGRFLTPDPLGAASFSSGSPQSLNGYAYSGNDPVNRVDPSGLLTMTVFWKRVCFENDDCHYHILGSSWNLGFDGGTTLGLNASGPDGGVGGAVGPSGDPAPKQAKPKCEGTPPPTSTPTRGGFGNSDSIDNTVKAIKGWPLSIAPNTFTVGTSVIGAAQAVQRVRAARVMVSVLESAAPLETAAATGETFPAIMTFGESVGAVGGGLGAAGALGAAAVVGVGVGTVAERYLFTTSSGRKPADWLYDLLYKERDSTPAFDPTVGCR